MRLRLLFSESIRSLGANLSTTVAATMTVLIGMFLLGLCIALGSWANDFGKKQEEKLLTKVFFCTPSTCAQDVTEDQINAVRRTLTTPPLDEIVKEVTFVPKKEALERMRKREPEIVANLTSNPLPDAFEVKTSEGKDVKAVSEALRQGGLPPGVDKVTDGEEVSDRIVRVAGLISTAFAVATLILLISSALLIANTIRLSIFSRRREIEVMKLVGATNWFVRGPFMIEGLLCGVAGSVIAILLLLFARATVYPELAGRFESSSGAEAWPFTWIAAAILLVGLTVGGLGSGVTLRRFLNV